jgi:beta-alanine--pyruvate transaminase
MELFERGLDTGILLRFTGDTLAVAPPFIATEDEIELMVARIRELLRELK